MQPFSELVKLNSKFDWADNLDPIFKQSELNLVKVTEGGMITFDSQR